MAELRTIENFIDKIFDTVLGLCPACGISAPGVCPACWSSWKREGPFLLRSDPFPQRSLLRWDESNEKSVRRLVLSMKVRPRNTILTHWARELSLALAVEWGRSQFEILHPPGRSGRREMDHSGALAFEVARLLGAPLGPELKRSQPRRNWGQKLAGRQKRRELKFISSEEESLPRTLDQGALPMVFVDDVLTSGATAEAAWHAIGQPVGFQAWSIFGRDRLDS